MTLKTAEIKKPHPKTKHLLFPLLIIEEAKKKRQSLSMAMNNF